MLGLTFMHGSRRRLTTRLRDSCIGTDLKVVCETIDAFCLSLVRRFRGLAGLNDSVIHPVGAPLGADGDALVATYLTFGEIRVLAESIIVTSWVSAWLANSYTCVVVDEFQDCSADLLGVMQALAGCLPTFAAADEFQLLDSNGACQAVDWLREIGSVVELSKVHRTTNPSLLAAATALRDGTRSKTGLQVLECQAAGLAAWRVAERIAWQGWGPSRDISVALLSPVGVGKSKFFRDTLQSLRRQLGQKTRIGPYPFELESTSDISGHTRELLDLIGALPDRVPLSSVRVLESEPSIARLAANCRARGRITIDKTELVQAAERSAHAARFSTWRGERGRVATTIHGAKNREFDYVAVLWPYEAAGDDEHQRRLLYNGVTRAKRDAIVLVQGQGRATNNSPLFGLL